MARVIIHIDREIKDEEDYIKVIAEVKKALIPIATEEVIDNKKVCRLMFALVGMMIHSRHCAYGIVVHKLKGTKLKLYIKEKTRNEINDLLAEFEYRFRNELYKDTLDNAI